MKDIQKEYKKAYGNISLSSNFKERTTKKIFGRAKSGMPKKTAVAMLAAVMAVLLFAGSVFAAEMIEQLRLSSVLEFSEKTDNYAQKLELSQEKDGLKITMTDAVFENGILYLNLNYIFDGADTCPIVTMMGCSVFVNGEKILCSGFSKTKMENDVGHIIVDLHPEDADVFLKGNAKKEICIVIDSVEVFFEDGSTNTISENWEYRFVLDADALSEETAEYLIGKEAELANGDKITVEKIICTPISQRIIYTVDHTGSKEYRSYLLDAEAQDDLGNEYCFVFSKIHDGICESVNIDPDDFSKESKLITLDILIRNREGEVLLKLYDVQAKKSE